MYSKSAKDDSGEIKPLLAESMEACNEIIKEKAYYIQQISENGVKMSEDTIYCYFFFFRILHQGFEKRIRSNEYCSFKRFPQKRRMLIDARG